MSLPSGTIKLGPQNGSLTVRTHREGLGARAGHDLVIEATRWEGTLQAPGGPLDVHVDARSLEVREGKGGAKPLTDKDRRDIKSTLESRILQAETHPEISFHAEGLSRLSEAGASAGGPLEGSLEMNGRVQPATVDVKLEQAGGRLNVRGAATVRQTSWGIKPYTALLGALRVADQVEIVFELEVPVGAA
ncbi:MAG: YceI family protein [Candidatus Dormibacteraceae bacterium]